MALIEGTAGSIKAGPGSGTVVNFIGEWEAEISEDVKTQGPFIGNPNISKIRAGLDCKGGMSGVIPVDGDTGQRLIRDAILDRTDIQLIFTVTDGETLTIATAIITSYTVGQKADEGVPISFDFEANGGFTLVDAA